MPGPGQVFIHQIFYDAATKALVSPGYIPLDNTENARPDWYEFWVILNYLRNNPLQDDAWYGFLSPRFQDKTGCSSDLVRSIIDRHGQTADAVLLSPAWDQVAYFLNVFEQGEFWIPGLTQLTQDFLNTTHIKVDLKSLVMSSKTSVHSNYIIAKNTFWLEWLALAEKFWNHVEHNPAADSRLKGMAPYGHPNNLAPVKTFIQERFASVILALGDYSVLSPDFSSKGPIWERLFADTRENRQHLQVCDSLKQKYIATKDEDYLKKYWQVRNEVSLKTA